MDYKVYEINGNFWAIATDIKLFTMKWRRIWKRPVEAQEYNIDECGMYEPLEVFKDVKALNDKKDIILNGESYRYISFKNMLKEFYLDGSAVPLYGIDL